MENYGLGMEEYEKKVVFSYCDKDTKEECSTGKMYITILAPGIRELVKKINQNEVPGEIKVGLGINLSCPMNIRNVHWYVYNTGIKFTFNLGGKDWESAIITYGEIDKSVTTPRGKFQKLGESAKKEITIEKFASIVYKAGMQAGIDGGDTNTFAEVGELLNQYTIKN